jgi:hypothetical protein
MTTQHPTIQNPAQPPKTGVSLTVVDSDIMLEPMPQCFLKVKVEVTAPVIEISKDMLLQIKFQNFKFIVKF